MHVCFCHVCFSFFSVLSQETGWEEHLRNDLFCRVGHKTLTQSIHQSLVYLAVNLIIYSSTLYWIWCSFVETNELRRVVNVLLFVVFICTLCWWLLIYWLSLSVHSLFRMERCCAHDATLYNTLKPTKDLFCFPHTAWQALLTFIHYCMIIRNISVL